MPYYCKDGRVLNTHDFVQTQVSIEDFLIRFDEYIKDFLPHNERAKWEDDDWNYLWDHIHEYEKDGKWAFATVQDYSESYHHKHKNEHSSQYFSEVSSSLYGCMLRVPIMAASDSYISAERKLELVAFCKQQGLPPLLTIPFFGISPDLHHDTAFVQTSMRCLVASTAGWQSIFPAPSGCTFFGATAVLGSTNVGVTFAGLATIGTVLAAAAFRSSIRTSSRVTARTCLTRNVGGANSWRTRTRWNTTTTTSPR